MAAPVAVQGAEQLLAPDHLPQRRHHRGRRFFLHQLRIVDLAAGIIQDDDQVAPAFILKPAMPAAVHVQQPARQGSPRSPLAMRPALAPLGHQTGPLQQAFHPTVAQRHLVLGRQLLVKVAHVQVEILLPVQLQHLLHFRQRHPLGRRLAPPPVIQTANPELLVALPPAPHLPVADANDFCRLPPGNRSGNRSQNHFFYFHRPLHRGLGLRDHALHALSSLPLAKRTLHVLSQPDISCATDTL